MITNRTRFAIAVIGAAVALQGFVGCGSDSKANFADGAAASGAGTTASGTSGASGSPGSSGSSAGRPDLDAATSGSGGSSGNRDRDGGDAAADAEIPGDSGPPPATDSGLSVYALECRGDSKDCNGASVPCFGLLGDAGPVGYGCSNRCESAADCSTAPSGAESEVDCVQLTTAGHCLLVCKRETQEFACPEGMGCYVYPSSPLGYCLWM